MFYPVWEILKKCLSGLTIFIIIYLSLMCVLSDGYYLSEKPSDPPPVNKLEICTLKEAALEVMSQGPRQPLSKSLYRKQLEG